MSKSILRLKNVGHRFIQGKRVLEILKDVNLSINSGELVALVGPSGSGKSTILHVAGILEQPSQGNIFIKEKPCHQLRDKDKTLLRRKEIGFVYQYHHLLPEFSAKENIMIPQLIAGLDKKTARSRSEELLKMMGLKNRENHKPSELSGGEQQRVAILRALANAPSLLLADEPTGNLDPKTSQYVFGYLKTLVNELQIATLFVTHNLDLAKKADRGFRLQNGYLESFS